MEEFDPLHPLHPLQPPAIAHRDSISESITLTIDIMGLETASENYII